jgi:RNA polymerase sigma-70 factor (ECF subfamily)
MDDAEAIQRLRRGDVAALEVLVQRYQLRAARAAFLVVRDRELAQDVVQSAFLRVFERSGRSFDSTRPFGPWFMKLVLNDALKAANRRSREVHLVDSVSDNRAAADPELHPELAFDLAETADEIWEALGALSLAQRVAIVQRYYLELTEAEIAAALDCPPTTIKARLHAARERLRTLLRAVSNDLETSP